MRSLAARAAALVLVPALGLGVTPACASPTGPRDALGWLEARGADVMDVFGVRVGFGVGLGAYVRVTQLLQLGFMFRGPSERFLPRPKDVQVRAVPCFMVGTIGRYGGAWFDTTSEVMVPGWSTRDAELFYIDREVIAGYVTPHGRGDRWRWSIGAGAHLVLAGVEAEVRPFEVLDLLAGLIGYDPSSDDVPVLSTPAGADDES